MTDTEWKGLVAIVTGASRGIGRAITLCLAERGVDLALVARHREQLEEVSLEAERRGGRALALALDLAHPDAPTQIVERTTERFGRLDLLINNAALAYRAPLEQTDANAFDRLMAVNVRAPLLLCRQALPQLRKSNRATIVNIASVAAHRGYSQEGAYAASKHALLGLTRVLARELQQDGIRVHLVSPGGVQTSMAREMDPHGDESTRMAPQEVARAVCFLIDSSSHGFVDEIRLRRACAEPSF